MTSSSAELERLAQNLWLERELLRVDELLEGIPFVVFKGVFLSRRLHGNLSQRASADNDLLVRARDGRRALQRLESVGYRPVLEGLNAEEALRRLGQVALEPPDPGRPSLDLHVRAFSANFFRVDEDWLWGRRLREVEIHGRTFRAFDDALAFCHLVAHYVQHLFERDRLGDVARGVDTLARGLATSELDEAVRRTVGWRAVWFATAMAEAPLSLPSEANVARAFQRASTALFRQLGVERSSTFVRGAFAVGLSDHRAWGGAAKQAFFPAFDELEARYGQGTELELLLRHLRHRLLGR